MLNSNDTGINNPIDTRKELAKIAGVGGEKYYRTNKILKTDNEEIKEKLKNGDISVNEAVASPMKMAKCIQELERIKGIKVGRNQYTDKETVTQKDLANQIGLDERQLRNYKQLNDLIPDLHNKWLKMAQ
nr:MAG TPA: Protein sopB, SopB, F plasmid, centromere.98A [Caudoviricetes sp.]